VSDGRRQGDAYLVHPDAGPGPGVLVLHSWWGLTPGVKRIVERLADLGYTALAPDLCGGEVPVDADAAQRLLVESDPNVTADLILKSASALRSVAVDDAPIAVVGYSMGASWALWLATRAPAEVSAVVVHYGSQTIDFVDLTAPVLGHFAEHDPLVSDDERVELQSHLLLLDKHVEFHHYEGTSHWFAEPGVESHHDPEATELADHRTAAFLATHHPV
jgi:carboxymethylenebutenolidase